MHNLVTVLLWSRRDMTDGEVGALLALPLVLLMLAFFYIWWKERYWNRGIFPPNLPGSDKNRVKGFLIATAIMLQKDKVELSGKWEFVDEFLQYYFPGTYTGKSYLYNDAFKRSVSLRSLASWFNHCTTAEDRQQLIDFLSDVALQDGEVNDREYAMILMLATEFKCDTRSIEARLKEFRPQGNGPLNKTPGKKSICQIVLGVGSDISPEELKKAYRKLAKQFHPDKFMLKSVTEREEAATKFREIKEAYEYLSEHA
jgi:DnaJ-domain-containing protein 1